MYKTFIQHLFISLKTSFGLIFSSDLLGNIYIFATFSPHTLHLVKHVGEGQFSTATVKNFWMLSKPAFNLLMAEPPVCPPTLLEQLEQLLRAFCLWHLHLPCLRKTSNSLGFILKHLWVHCFHTRGSDCRLLERGWEWSKHTGGWRQQELYLTASELTLLYTVRALAYFILKECIFVLLLFK